MKTVYFPWNHPVLHSAAKYLVDTFLRDGRLDMRHVLLALPGSRAVSRLEELLLEQVEQRVEAGVCNPAWYPPQLLTIGRLPELLYPQKRPLADDLTQQFAWIAALDDMQKNEPDVLFHLFQQPPDLEDISARLTLAKMFAAVHRELAADVLQFDDVRKKCAERGQTAESIRWQTLARLQQKYLEILNDLELWDVQTARIFAIKYAEPATDKTIILVGTVDLNQAQKRILDFVSDNVVSLVFAPESHRSLFDQYGCLLSKQWKDVPIPIADEQIEVVDTPSDQATAAARWIAEKTTLENVAEEITLGVPDESVIPLVRQQFSQAGVRTRAAAGTPFSQTAPYKFLELVANLVKTRRYSGFADLLRHPVVESFLPEGFSETLLTEADRYHSEHFPSELDDWRHDVNPTLQEAWMLLKAALEPLLKLGRLPSDVWCERLTPVLEQFFKQPVPKMDDLFERIAVLPGFLVRKFDASEFLEMVLRELQSVRVPPLVDKGAIEILGWLDLAMDDAPILALTCVNEGIIPSSLNSDLFLPDGMRSALGIEDNDRRFARDAYALSVILEAKNNPSDVKLISGRRDTEGNPLLPSRLLFADGPETVARRVQRFFQVKERTTPVIFPGTFRADREKAAFGPPPVKRPLDPVKSMRVTEFRDYLACPYRYYLRHRLGLDVLHDHDEELDAAKFGNVLHEVLRRFGLSDIRNSTDRNAIVTFLSEELDKIATETYGEKPRAVVAVQVEQLRYRLNAFADWQ
ncbi:MAG: PD-(D/E)XK nuclease family protein, partial [Planctomycetaceae bacterium]|nr:PD-(D/E)XK nuclease family protein [Planctomycetaceae bacterium]